MKTRIIGCRVKSIFQGLKLALHELICIYPRVLATSSLSLCMHKYFVYLRTWYYLLIRWCLRSEPSAQKRMTKHAFFSSSYELTTKMIPAPYDIRVRISAM